MKSHDSIFLGLGTNLGDRRANLLTAIDHIQHQVGRIVQQSSVYVSAPQGFAADTDFYNQVLEISSDLGPEELLKRIKSLESLMGRVKLLEKGYESRIIDIDILDYKGGVFQFNSLTIPHGQMHLRSFVLLPLVEIAPNWIHPVLELPIADLILRLDSAGRAEKMPITND